MTLHPKTVVALLKYLKKEISFYSKDLLRLEGLKTSKELLAFRIEEYIKASSADITLRNFDFDEFSRDVLNKDPDKDITISCLIKWALQSISPHPSSKILIKKFQHFSEKKEGKEEEEEGEKPTDLFFQTLHNSKFDQDYKQALFEFIDFGRQVLYNAFASEEQYESIPKLSKMMTAVLVNTVYGETYFDDPAIHIAYLQIFSSIISDCLRLSDKTFKNIWVPEPEKEEPSLLRRTFNHFKHSSSSSSSIPLHSNSDSHSVAFSSIPSILPFSPSVSPASPSLSSPFSLPPSIPLILPEATPRLFFSAAKEEKEKKKNEERTREIAQMVSFIQQEDLINFEMILSEKSNPQQYINSASTYTLFRRSFLQIAVIHQKTGFIHLLRKLDADITHQDKHGQTAYHHAALWKTFDADCFAALLSFPNIWEIIKTTKNQKGYTAFDLMNKSAFKNKFLSYQPKEKQKIKLN